MIKKKNIKQKQMKTDTGRKLIHRLYGLIIIIVVTCLIAWGVISVYSSDVTRQSELMEETAALQQDFSELINHLNQTSVIYYQLSISGYSQDLTEDADQSLTEARDLFADLTSRVEEEDSLGHYFDHLNESITTYQSIYEENFTSIFLGDEVERIRIRVVPVITRTEETINSINERIQDDLSMRRDETSSALQQSLARSSMISTIVLTILVIVTLVSLLLFSKSLRSGVTLVMKRIRAYHEGDLSYDHSTNRKDEFSTIDTRLKDMGKQLHSIINRNRQVSEDVLDVVQAASQKSSEQLQGMGEIALMMDEFSEEMDRQSDFTDTISATTEEVSSSSGEIQNSIGKVNKQLKELESVSNQGLELMNQLEHTMKELNQQTSSTGNRVDTMQDQLEHIQSFIEGIDGIASQTNLLAINASIEAAKAGEEGRGFSVVANEIRNLSQGTNDFSNQIKEVLEGLGEDVSQVVSAFSHLKTETAQSLEKSTESATIYKQISNDNSTVTREHQEIDQSIMEINKAIESVAISITELASGANVLQDKGLSVTEIVEDQRKRQEELTNEVRSLEETAKLLNS